MSSTTDQFVTSAVSADAEELWADGATLANHPRVRVAQWGPGRVTVHRHPRIPPGIEVLAHDPHLTDFAGLRLLGRQSHVMDFVEGRTLDSLAPTEDLAEPIVAAMSSVWDRPVDHVADSSREKPVIAPITRAQYIEMPDAVLAAATEHRAAARRALERTSARGPGRAIIHGDLKADNVIVSEAGGIRFIDWECCGAGHPEDDIASLLASMCVYQLGRAVRTAALTSDGSVPSAALAEHVSRALDDVRRFSGTLLLAVRSEAPRVSTDELGAAFLLSALCRLQGLLFVPSSESLRLVVSEFVRRTSQSGPGAVRNWLFGRDALPESGQDR